MTKRNVDKMYIYIHIKCMHAVEQEDIVLGGPKRSIDIAFEGKTRVRTFLRP